MKNIITGWITSIFGLAIMIADGLYLFGYIEMPAPESVPKWVQIVVPFLVGFILFRMPETLEKYVVQILDLAFGWLKKKSE